MHGEPVVASLAVHELDVRPLEAALVAVLTRHLPDADPDDYELHATDLRCPNRGPPAGGGRGPKPPSEWLPVDRAVRQAVTDDVYAAITGYRPVDPERPVKVIGAVVERTHRRFRQADEKAYDHVLHKFDELLLRLNRDTGADQRGRVLHDRREKLEKPIQQWTRGWQRGGLRLANLAAVPMFADSKAARLLPAADFVAYAVYRHYSNDARDPAPATPLWPLVDTLPDGRMTGFMHLTPAFGAQGCPCLPCRSRP